MPLKPPLSSICLVEAPPTRPLNRRKTIIDSHTRDPWKNGEKLGSETLRVEMTKTTCGQQHVLQFSTEPAREALIR